MERQTLNNNHSQTRKKKVLVVLAALIAALLFCIGIFIWGRHGPLTPFDPNAADAPQTFLTEEDMLRELQKAADESAFRFKINSEVTVVGSEPAGSGEENSQPDASHQTANWNIINSIENSSNVKVTITGKDGTPLFESRILRPGEQELTGTLLTELAPGTYEAEAAAKVMDPETEEVLGNVTAEITLQVQ